MERACRWRTAEWSSRPTRRMASAFQAKPPQGSMRVTRPRGPRPVARPGHALKLLLGADAHTGGRLCWGRRRGLGLLVQARVELHLLARAALHELLAVAERRLQRRVGLLGAERQRLLDRPAGILMVVELGRGRALRLARLGVALEVVGQRREADREVIAVAQAHADGAVGGERQIAELVGGTARRFALLPAAEQHGERVACRIALARLLFVLAAAAVAGELAHDVVLHRAVAGAHDLLALAVEVGQPPARVLDFVVVLDAAGIAAQGSGKEELVPAVGALQAQTRRAVRALQLADVRLDLGQHLASLTGPLHLGHQPLLKLQTDIAGTALVERLRLRRGWRPLRRLLRLVGLAWLAWLDGRQRARRRLAHRLARDRRVLLAPRPPLGRGIADGGRDARAGAQGGYGEPPQ